jgi:hypothetical protein
VATDPGDMSMAFRIPVITVIGKAFFDIGHALEDQSNRRSHQPGYAAWEIHPVMALHVDGVTAAI